MRLRGTLAAALLAGAVSCGRAADPSPAEAPPDRLAPLHAFEEARRAAADFAHLPPSDRALGPDPIAIRRLPGAAPRFAGLLRGRDALVLLDASLREIARAPAPALPTGLAIAADGEIFVSGEQSAEIARYRVDGEALRRTGAIDPGEGVRGLRDVAAGDRAIYAVDERDGRLFAIPLASPEKRSVLPVGAGAFRVAVSGDRLIVDCLLDHTLTVLDLDAHGMPVEGRRAVIHHDGPIWGFAALSTPAGLVIAAGGVEDHPLDRTEGSFGFIDSFVFLYRIAAGSAEPERVAAVNVSSEGVITPKALLIREAPGGGVVVSTAGYGSDRLAEIAWSRALAAAPVIMTRSILPGVASMTASGDVLAFADPLFDAWFQLSPPPTPAPAPAPTPTPVPDSSPPRPASSRVGEALFFTNLMAPWNRSDGRLSRFTCETCHFEGTVDGRTHHTGRGDVHATTKPLRGLFNNRPHFSRALDPDMATMVNNEFRVAGALSDHDPWFSAKDAALPWVPLLGAGEADLDALGLRRSLMTFLMDFTHRPNPAVLGRSTWTAIEREGAGVFARRCESCHAARLASDEPASAVAFDRWEALVMSREGPIVWGDAAYHRTGVEPYVHDKGARAPSLRRLYAKRPYFTNGAAKSLRDVLDRARIGDADFRHDGGAEGLARLDEGEKAALLAFLELL